MLCTTFTCGTLNMLSRTVGYCTCARLLVNLFCRDKTCLCEEKFPFRGNYGAASVSRFASFLLHANLCKHHKMSSRTLAQLQYRLCWGIQSIKVTRCKVPLSSFLSNSPRSLVVAQWWEHSPPTNVAVYFIHLRTVPTIVIAHTFCASPDTRISNRQCLLIQGSFCAV